MSVYSKIEKQIVESIKGHDNDKRDSLRFLKSNIQKVSKDTKTEIDDDMCISVSKKLIKQNKESINLGTNEAAKLNMEINYWESFLPKMLNETETSVEVKNAIAEVKAESVKDMGKVMGVLKKKHGQIIDMSLASKTVKKILMEV